MTGYRVGATAQVTEGPLRGVIGRIDDVRNTALSIRVDVLPPRLDRSHILGERVWMRIVHTKLIECAAS